MRYLFIPLIFLGLASCQRNSVQISEFRGPDRSGNYIAENLMNTWPAGGPEQVFFIDSVGKGYGPPVISENLMYLTGARDSFAILFCFDLAGTELWELALGKEWVVNYPGSRSSPTVAGDLIYVGTGMGDLFCINKTDQSICWSKDFVVDFDGILPLFGHSESAVVHKDKVFWTTGGEKYNVVALNRFSGELIWSNKGFSERSGYNPPRVITTEAGREIFVTFSAYHLMGFDVETGELLWSHEQDNYPVEKRKPGYGDTHANTIIYDNGAIYYAAGDGNGGVKLDLSEDGEKIEEIWRNKGFDSFMGGIIKLGEYIYGSGTRSPSLVSIEAKTGIIVDSLAIGRGSIISADHMIYYYSQRGSVHLVSFDEGKLDAVSEFRIDKGSQEHFSHPLIHNGVLYIRHGNVVLGYDIEDITN